MKIERIEAMPIVVPFASRSDLPAWRGRDYGALEALLIKIETSDGITGWGEAFSYNCQGSVRAAAEQMLAPMLIGRDSRQITGLMHEAQKVLHIYGRHGALHYALSGIDIALWDIAGKRAGRPVCDLLGGAVRSQINAYASLFRFGSAERVAAAATEAIGAGYKRVKIHTRDVAEISAVREALGDEAVFMADTNCAWSIDEAFRNVRAMRDLDLKWLEEPLFPPEDFTTLAAIRRETGVPLAAGENICGAYDFQKLIASGAVSYVQPSVIKVGGITEFRKVIALAEVNGVTLAPHSPYYGPGFLATLHLIASQPEPCFIEYFRIGLEAMPYGDRTEPVAGALAVPEQPGLGFEPDSHYLKEFRA
ncbi:MAG TPA: mandelate racemase/muconate lactonizing enzyme family protein [Pseudolabrys sp.]|nr:mandelate racemase/muconate lactonizing enzyme family protein [Pseudolabrys sp.]